GSRVPLGAARHGARAGPHPGRGAARCDRGRSAGAAGLPGRARARARKPMSGGLVLDRVEAGYGETVVLEGISLALQAGGSLAVLGRDGVGKTTLLATIMGHCLLRAGEIRFARQRVSGAAAHRRVALAS